MRRHPLFVSLAAWALAAWAHAAAAADEGLVLVARQDFEAPAAALDGGGTMFAGDGWCLVERPTLDPRGEGPCRLAAFDGSGERFWSGEVGCTVYPAPRRGVFFSYYPVGSNGAELYDLDVSERPVAATDFLPTEHAYADDGSLVLFGGGVLALYETSGRELFTRRQRHQRDMALGIGPGGGYVVVADLLAGSDRAARSAPPARGKSTGRRSRPAEPQFATILTADGEAGAEVAIPGFARAVAVSGDGRMLAVACGSDLVVLRADGTTVWKHRFEDRRPFVRRLSVDEAGRLVAVYNAGQTGAGSEARFLGVWNERGESAGLTRLDDRRALDFYDTYVSRDGDRILFRDDRGKSVWRIAAR